MTLVGDDQVEKTYIELGKAIHHPRVGSDVDARGLIHFVGFTNDTARLAGQILLEGIVSLNSQLLSVTEKQHTLSPAGA
ncbi:hypothetical protein D3C75_1166150 [compost metagenome]